MDTVETINGNENDTATLENTVFSYVKNRTLNLEKQEKSVKNNKDNNQWQYIKKEITLNYLSSSALNADATNNQEFIVSTNIIKYFESKYF